MKWLMMSMTALAFAAPALTDTDNYVPRFDPERLSAEVKTLSSDAFEGRGPATPGETKTVEYLVAQMQAAGLEPGGDLVNGGRGWTQAVPLARFQITGSPNIGLDINGKRQPLTQGKEIALRRAGSPDRARNQVGLVRLGHGEELQHQRAVRHRAR